MFNVITIEREYGAGAALIAKDLATRLGWTLWDGELTEEIARRLKCDVASVEKREERLDPTFYRLAKIFMRGSYESSFTGHDADLLDAESLAHLFEKVILDVAGRGRCVIVGRAAPWFLRGREDVFHAFIYAPRDFKIQRIVSQGKSRSEAEHLVDTVDDERAAFVKKYHNKIWPKRDLYHMMLNAKVGTDIVVDLILNEMQALDMPRKRSA